MALLLEGVADDPLGKQFRRCDDVPPHIRVRIRRSVARVVAVNAMVGTCFPWPPAVWALDELLATLHVAANQISIIGMNDNIWVEVADSVRQWMLGGEMVAHGLSGPHSRV